MKTVETHILIVGAGASGLALAAELRRLKIPSLIVDKGERIQGTSRAAVVHARTLEVLRPLGVAKDLIAEGEKVPVFCVRDRDRTLVKIDFRGIASDFNFTLMCPQDRTERLLTQRLEALGGTVTRSASMQTIVDLGSKVIVHGTISGEEACIHAEWVVGCDGMHSVVREQSAIPFSGSEYEESFVLADVRMEWPLSRNEVNLFFSPEGLVVVAPLPDNRFRIVATKDSAPETPNSVFMQELLDARGPELKKAKIREMVWSSRFRVHHRLAETPRKGRILLCGDAAHVHSPAGGQGMNTGIQDSISLAGVLDQMLSSGDEHVLDRWAIERHRIAKGVVTLTDRMTRMATIKSPVARILRNAGLSMVARLPAVQLAIAERLAELRH